MCPYFEGGSRGYCPIDYTPSTVGDTDWIIYISTSIAFKIVNVTTVPVAPTQAGAAEEKRAGAAELWNIDRRCFGTHLHKLGMLDTNK